MKSSTTVVSVGTLYLDDYEKVKFERAVEEAIEKAVNNVVARGRYDVDEMPFGDGPTRSAFKAEVKVCLEETR
jgi:hypothetical protein